MVKGQIINHQEEDIKKLGAPYFYLPTFYKTNEIITTTNTEQEWFLDKNWKNHLVMKMHGNKTFYWVDQENSRTRIDADSLEYNEDDDAWQGSPTLGDNPSSFRINVATTTSGGKAWSDNPNIPMTYEEFAKNGYLIDKNDFKNFEGTIYWRRIGDWIDEKKDDDHRKCEGCKKPDQMTIYGRGGVHVSGDKFPENCLAACYKGSFDYKKG